ncbi:hypothetical protein ABT112_26775 [Streptomyces sp. NPDC002055]|uniref:hypothetical protein n=1 Tax=Streptomyces sp. NPDC002055 TaxID=3154534 RepID=UPI00331E7CDA
MNKIISKIMEKREPSPRTDTNDTSKEWKAPSSRGTVLSILGVVTLGVAILSVAVSYKILEPKFGGWAVPTVGALDALWVVFQITEILAGNNSRRASRVRSAGLFLTAVNAAIPTAHLVLSGGKLDLAVVLTPLAIVATKTAWWFTLPSLGRRVSPTTRQKLDAKRQTVSDRLEEMEAEAAHRIELLELATTLEKGVAKAETAYRKSVLKRQQTTTKTLHKQAQATEKTVAETGLPDSVASIPLPVLEDWTPNAPALPGTPGRDASVTGTPALPAGRDASGTDTGTDGTASGTGRDTTGTQVNAGAQGAPSHPDAEAAHPEEEPSRQAAHTVTLEELAAVAGVPVPVPDAQLTDAQVGVVLRHLRYRDEPPASYRQARVDFRGAGFVGSEERIRQAWAALMTNEKTDGEETSEDDAEETEEEGAPGA